MDDKLIEFENQRLQNTKKLNQASESDHKSRMSKRAKKNLLKIQNNEDLDEVTKQEKLDKITKRQKTSDSQSKFYVDGEK